MITYHNFLVHKLKKRIDVLTHVYLSQDAQKQNVELVVSLLNEIQLNKFHIQRKFPTVTRVLGRNQSLHKDYMERIS